MEHPDIFPPQAAYDSVKDIYVKYLAETFEEEPRLIEIARAIPATHCFQAELRLQVMEEFAGTRIEKTFRNLQLNPKDPCELCFTYYGHYKVRIEESVERRICCVCLPQHFNLEGNQLVAKHELDFI